ncbi:MAG: excinuclease ABC subunit UvrA, partial [Patescibacteria group bacterium]
MAQQTITIRGCRVNNLKDVSLDIPHNALVVFTGLSGSGKSSLAFDTIHAEGQRRFMESLSSFTKHFLENIDKPDADKIEGLPPTIAIDQRAASSSPRSTVGTATEIYDALRLLFARAGTPHCPSCGNVVTARSRQQIITDVTRILKETDRPVRLCAPLKKLSKIDAPNLLEELEKLSIRSVRIDGRVMTLREMVTAHLDFERTHTIDIIVDLFDHPSRDAIDAGRVVRQIHRALELGDGTLLIEDPQSGHDATFTLHLRCTACKRDMERVEPRHFSFNNPIGACPSCAGLGVLLQFDPDLVIPNPKLTVAQGAIGPLAKLYANTHGLSESIDELLKKVAAS